MDSGLIRIAGKDVSVKLYEFVQPFKNFTEMRGWRRFDVPDQRLVRDARDLLYPRLLGGPRALVESQRGEELEVLVGVYSSIYTLVKHGRSPRFVISGRE